MPKTPSSFIHQTKSSKRFPACSNCHRLKTRCELLDLQPPVQCHRCKRLQLPCSYSEMEDAFFQQRESPVTSLESVTPETAISLFASAFHELQSVSPGERNAHAARPGQPIIDVNALPTRIRQWFGEAEKELDWSAPIACIATLKWRPPLTPTSSALQTRPDRIEAILTKDQVSYLLHQ
jgi:hypothetical protein